MKVILAITISFFFVCCQAETWQEYWIAAVNFCEDQNYDKASEYFDKAVAGMEQEGDFDHPHVYVDRARLKMLLNQHNESLADLDKALSNENIQYQDRERALVSRIGVRSNLGMDQGVLEDLKAFGEMKVDKPIVEHTKTHLIIRNAPNCDCYRKLMTYYFTHSGMCESENDIKILNSRTWIINKSGNYATRPD